MGMLECEVCTGPPWQEAPKNRVDTGSLGVPAACLSRIRLLLPGPLPTYLQPPWGLTGAPRVVLTPETHDTGTW
jgi:hypothetical protein